MAKERRLHAAENNNMLVHHCSHEQLCDFTTMKRRGLVTKVEGVTVATRPVPSEYQAHVLMHVDGRPGKSRLRERGSNLHYMYVNHDKGKGSCGLPAAGFSKSFYQTRFHREIRVIPVVHLYDGADSSATCGACPNSPIMSPDQKEPTPQPRHSLHMRSRLQKGSFLR
jgi:hypothetical protein